MINHNLINECVCGNKTTFNTYVTNSILVAKCDKCGVVHQSLPGWNSEKYVKFYESDYHEHYQESRGTETYTARYNHDRNVSKLRLNEYTPVINKGSVGLDIGSSNSAFVHECNDQGYKVIGLEPGKHIGDNQVTIRGTLESVNLEGNHYDFITMHDSIEHMVNINSALEKIHNLLASNGVLILDLPDYFNTAGKHHWKHIEHLWFFSKDDMISILSRHNLQVFKITEPIPGKLVFYSRKKQ